MKVFKHPPQNENHPCWDAVNAIDFALDELDDHFDRQEFLTSWRQGSFVHMKEWQDYIDFCEKKEGYE